MYCDPFRPHWNWILSICGCLFSLFVSFGPVYVCGFYVEYDGKFWINVWDRFESVLFFTSSFFTLRFFIFLLLLVSGLKCSASFPILRYKFVFVYEEKKSINRTTRKMGFFDFYHEEEKKKRIYDREAAVATVNRNVILSTYDVMNM